MAYRIECDNCGSRTPDPYFGDTPEQAVEMAEKVGYVVSSSVKGGKTLTLHYCDTCWNEIYGEAVNLAGG